MSDTKTKKEMRQQILEAENEMQIKVTMDNLLFDELP